MGVCYKYKYIRGDTHFNYKLSKPNIYNETMPYIRIICKCIVFKPNKSKSKLIFFIYFA